MHADQSTNPYLQQEVMTVSPIRLRWMLVQRAESLCLLVSKLWSEDKQGESVQWLIRIREILCELLDGVVDPKNPVSKAVCDFYVYLLRLLTEVDQTHSPAKLRTLRDLLAIEAETWKLAVEKFDKAKTEMVTKAVPMAPAVQAYVDGPHATAGGFSLEV